jgi:hypothetical protein
LGRVITFISFLWGDWPAPGRGAEYVRKSHDAVMRNAPFPHRYICFCDEKNIRAVEREGIEARPLKAPSWRGCLPKLYAYSPEAGLCGRVIILDLDNIITGDLTPLAEYDGDLAVRAWFRGYDRGEKVADGDMIAFEAGSLTAQRLWAAAIEDVSMLESETGGRERYFMRRFKPDLWQDILGPRAIISYKNHMRRREPPEECIIVSCHDAGAAEPTCRPHQLKEPWVRKHWR